MGVIFWIIMVTMPKIVITIRGYSDQVNSPGSPKVICSRYSSSTQKAPRAMIAPP